jgi:hypothetical protein
VNSGKTLFAQLMDFLPWSTFTRIVARYRGDQRVRTLSCAEHYRAAFAQLTYRESLRESKPASQMGSCRQRATMKLNPTSSPRPAAKSSAANSSLEAKFPDSQTLPIARNTYFLRYCFSGTMTTRINFV